MNLIRLMTHGRPALCAKRSRGFFFFFPSFPPFFLPFVFEAVFVFPSLWVSYFVVVWHQREQSLIFTGKTVQQGVGNKTKSRWAAISSGRLFSLVVVSPPTCTQAHAHTYTRAHTKLFEGIALRKVMKSVRWSETVKLIQCQQVCSAKHFMIQ